MRVWITGQAVVALLPASSRLNRPLISLILSHPRQNPDSSSSEKTTSSPQSDQLSIPSLTRAHAPRESYKRSTAGPSVVDFLSVPDFVAAMSGDRSGWNSTNESTYDNRNLPSRSSADSEQARLRYPIDDVVAGRDRPSNFTWSDKLLSFLPSGVVRIGRSVCVWTKGPIPPRPNLIRPFFPKLQSIPNKWLNRVAPTRTARIIVLLGYYVLWIAVFFYMINKASQAGDIPGFGKSVSLSCQTSLWDSRNGCGLDGRYCRPFNNVSMPFRCPAECRLTTLLEPYGVGPTTENYRQLVIGGGPVAVDSQPYRADSFICAAAVHAGFLDDSTGGCGLLELTGEHTDYKGVNSNGIDSIPFDTIFPKSYRFVPGSAGGCKDPRWPIFAVTVTFSAILTIFASDAKVFFFSIFVSFFFHVALVSDPPSPNSTYDTLVSILFGRLLPSLFVAFVFWHWPVKYQHRNDLGRKAPIERLILWVGPCWVGILNNLTFDRLPLSRLTPNDLKQPGAISVLVILSLAILVAVLIQVWGLRIEGRLPRFLGLYGILVAAIVVMIALPNLNLRIHHYILAILLLPGTGLQTRPSLIFQGLLVGLFVNGIAKWGFDSVLQTSDELRGDASLGSPLPSILPNFPIININNAGIGPSGLPPNITFQWVSPSSHDQQWDASWNFDGVSILVNDVEQYNVLDDGSLSSREFVWERKKDQVPVPEYFRFAFTAGTSTADYTKAGTWSADAKEWVPMESGPSN